MISLGFVRKTGEFLADAFTLDDVGRRAHACRRSSVMLLFAAYSERPNGAVEEFLRGVSDYHAHSGQHTDVYCVGYSIDRYIKPDNYEGREFRLPAYSEPLSTFYPGIFHEVRYDLQSRLRGYWEYDGGVHVLVFSTTGDRENPVDWEYCAVVTSRRHVGRIYDDVEQMLRDTFNHAERCAEGLSPNELGPYLKRKEMLAGTRRVASAIGGDILGGLFGK
ncbi:hypothetical protein [Aureimonas sp. AU4]|uniref:hypothetical protein n=1 Tax=Aureimonas sp. AU4 TaxID=1638163 RepID=UPI000AA51A23|nr:hypothetical protein [Aureimonas sp. AU4]